MNTKQKTTKFIIFGFFALVLSIVASFGAFTLKQPSLTAYADNENTLPISISNANFNSDNTSSYPDTSFTGFTADYEASTDKESSLKAGVINLQNENYKNKFSNAKRGDGYDDYVLMIESNASIKYGYKTSSSNTIEIKPNSYYMVTFDVYTETDSNIANLYLFDGEKEFASITDINSYLNWQTYTFFVSTNDLLHTNLTLGMYLNGKGIVLFDNLSANQLSKEQYSTNIQLLETNNLPYSVTDSKTHVTANYKIESGAFVKSTGNYNVELAAQETIADGSSLKVTGFLPNKDTTDYTTATTEPSSDGVNSNALLINNKQLTYIQYSTEDNFLTFKQNQVYKVSLNLKTEELQGNANIQLVRTNASSDDKNAKDSSVVKITSNTDGYETYSFYVVADPYADTTYKLVVGLGDSETFTTGKLYVNTLTVSKIDYSTFSSANDTNKINLSTYYAYSDTSSLPMLNNGNFDAMQVSDVLSSKPATPADWTVKTGKNTQYYGVVNGSTNSFNNLKSLKTSNLLNPFGNDGANNNVLMMYNETDDTLSYTSKAKSLSVNSYYKFAVKVNTQINSNSSVRVSLVTTVDEEEVELVGSNVKTSSTGFEEVELFLHTGNQAIDVTLKVTLTTTGCGYAYVDEARYNYPLQPTETEFNNVVEDQFNVKKDLTNITLDLNYYTASNSDVVAKVINSYNNSDLINYVVETEQFKAIGNTDVIALRSANDTSYSLTSKFGYDITANNYYKVTVDAYTQFIDSTNTEIEAEKLGAGLKLVGFDNSFTAIQSNNQWTTYTFYVTSNSDTTLKLEFSLGSTDAETKGDVFFANVTFADVTESLTKEGFEDLTETDLIKVIKPTETDPEKDPETDPEEIEEKESLNVGTILTLAASLITAVALLIAVVGVALRKIKFKKPVKKSKNEYDRNKTVSKQVYTRRATTARENKLLELNKDLQAITEERAKFEESYKKDLAKLRELKIKRGNPAEISKLEKEIKKAQKQSASLGVTLNKIQSEIDYAKTDAYLNELMRKLAKEAQTQNNSTKE